MSLQIQQDIHANYVRRNGRLNFAHWEVRSPDGTWRRASLSEASAICRDCGVPGTSLGGLLTGASAIEFDTEVWQMYRAMLLTLAEHSLRRFLSSLPPGLSSDAISRRYHKTHPGIYCPAELFDHIREVTL
jgi:hypothetical protein